MKNTLSCIIPVKNGTKYLAECLESIKLQSKKIDQLIIVDDHSTDDLENFVIEMNLDCIFVKSPSHGHAAAMNCGLRQVKTELISFLDCDDIWTPNHVATLIKFFESDNSIDLAYGRVENVDENLKSINVSEVSRMLGSSIFHRRVFELNEHFDESLQHGSNIDFMVRIFARKINFVKVDDVVLLRRIHATNMGREKSIARQSIFQVIRKNRIRS